MSNLQLKPNYVMEVTSAELLLILKALGDRIQPDSEESEAAFALGDRMTLQRATQLRELSKTAEHLEAAVSNKRS